MIPTYRPDTHDVVSGLVVSVFGRTGECLYEPAARGHQLRRPGADLPFQLYGIIFQMIVMRLDDQRSCPPAVPAHWGRPVWSGNR